MASQKATAVFDAMAQRCYVCRIDQRQIGDKWFFDLCRPCAMSWMSFKGSYEDWKDMIREERDVR